MEKVKIILSGGFGYGFYTENLIFDCINDVKLIELIEKEDFDNVRDYINENYDWYKKDYWFEEESYNDLYVVEIDKDKKYKIFCEDGNEWVEEVNDDDDFGDSFNDLIL